MNKDAVEISASFAKVFYDHEPTPLMWAEVDYSRKNEEGFNEGFAVKIAFTDITMSVEEVPLRALEKANAFVKMVAAQLD